MPARLLLDDNGKTLYIVTANTIYSFTISYINFWKLGVHFANKIEVSKPVHFYCQPLKTPITGEVSNYESFI